MGEYSLNGRDLAAKTIEGETVLINLATGAYYSIAGAGAFAFARLAAGHDPEAVSVELAASYGIDQATAKADIERFVDELLEEGVLMTGGQAAQTTVETPTPAGPYETPVLEVYTDMEELLALDPPMPGLKDIPWEPPTS